MRDYRDSPSKAPKLSIRRQSTSESGWFRLLLVASVVAGVAGVAYYNFYSQNATSHKTAEVKPVVGLANLESVKMTEKPSEIGTVKGEALAASSETAKDTTIADSTKESLMSIKLDADFDSWSEERQREFMQKLSSILGRDVEVVGPPRRGSVILDVKLDPEEAARIEQEVGSMLKEKPSAASKEDDILMADDEEPEIVLHSGDHVDVETGLYTYSSISGVVFHDYDADGEMDSQIKERGVQGVIASLFATSGELVAKAVTDTKGEYSFGKADPGEYFIHFELPKGFRFSPHPTRTGDQGLIISDVSPSTGDSSIVVVHSGRKSFSVNAGVYATSSIEGVWFLDRNGNGRMDTDEKPLRGLAFERGVVELLAADSREVLAIAELSSSLDGSFKFTDLEPGQYALRFLPPLPDYVISQKWDSAMEGGKVYNQVDTASGEISRLVLLSNRTLNANVGVYQPVSVSGVVWEDMDGIGFSASAPEQRHYISAARVTLFTQSASVEPVMITTTKGGAFSFTNLRPGNYLISVDAPSRYLRSPRLPDHQRSEIVSKSNVGVLFSEADNQGRSPSYTLMSGESKADANFGFFTLASITGLVWDDLNANGIFDPATEHGLPEIPVILELKDGTVVGKAITDKDGRYTFLDLKPGRYRAPRITLPQDYHLSANAKIKYAYSEQDSEALLADYLN